MNKATKKAVAAGAIAIAASLAWLLVPAVFTSEALEATLGTATPDFWHMAGLAILGNLLFKTPMGGK